MMEEHDEELEAISSILAALGRLDSEARGRVLEYVFRRLSLQGAAIPSGSGASPRETVAEEAPTSSAQAVAPPSEHQYDIRTLREEKAPKSANEMAALVAYYLSELAPHGERRETIGTAEITKYFKQAKYPLPKVPRATLSNARAAGYFDHVSGGQYKLNPVGYNLVAHGLPRQAGRQATLKRTPRRKGTNDTRKVRRRSKDRSPSAATESRAVARTWDMSMAAPSDQWDAFLADLDRLRKAITESRAIHVGAARLRDEARRLVQEYFRQVRPGLQSLRINSVAIDDLDHHMQALLALANGRNRRTSYVGTLRSAA
jgi:hypothetical protein